MGYALPPRIRLAVDADFGPGLWIEIRHPRLLTWDQQREINAARRQVVDGGDPGEFGEVLARVLITDWNLPPLDASGPIAPIPATSADALKLVPADAVIMPLLQAIQPKRAANEEDPAGDPNSSGASVST